MSLKRVFILIGAKHSEKEKNTKSSGKKLGLSFFVGGMTWIKKKNSLEQ